MSDSQSDNRKALGGVLAAAGAILIALAVVRLNSLESQFLRGLGGTDNPATTMLVLGVPLALIGVWLLLSSAEPDRDGGTASDTGSGSSVPEDYDGPMVTCAKCGSQVPEPDAVRFLGKDYCPKDYSRELNG